LLFAFQFWCAIQLSVSSAGSDEREEGGWCSRQKEGINELRHARRRPKLWGDGGRQKSFLFFATTLIFGVVFLIFKTLNINYFKFRSWYLEL